MFQRKVMRYVFIKSISGEGLGPSTMLLECPYDLSNPWRAGKICGQVQYCSNGLKIRGEYGDKGFWFKGDPWLALAQGSCNMLFELNILERTVIMEMQTDSIVLTANEKHFICEGKYRPVHDFYKNAPSKKKSSGESRRGKNQFRHSSLGNGAQWLAEQNLNQGE